MSNALPPMPETHALLLRTDRLDLLPMTRDHAQQMFEVLHDPALYRYTSGSPPADVAALGRLYELWEGRRSPDGSELWFNWALEERGQRQFIGHLQAGVRADHANVAWSLGLRWQHLGYATEAAKAVVEWLLQLGVREIRASINPAHTASIRVAERLGLLKTAEAVDAEPGPAHPKCILICFGSSGVYRVSRNPMYLGFLLAL